MTTSLRVLESAELSVEERGALETLFVAAWPDERFTREDVDHMLGGRHVLLQREGRILSHAAVVPRTLWAGERAMACGYVEAMATWPELQRRGFGTEVLGVVNDLVRDGFEIGGLCTGSHGFYERVGWERWVGPLAVRTGGTEVPTPEEDGNVMILRTPATGAVSLGETLSCDWRAGDVW